MINIYKSKFFYKLTLSAFFFCFVLFVSSCKQEQEEKQKAPLRQVRTITVDAGTGIYERSFSGSLHSSQETSLSFKISGTIKEISVKVGDLIKKGDVIAQLDPSTYALEVQQSQASLAEARSEQRNAKSNYTRIKKLYVGGNVSKSQLDNARTSSDSAAASVQSVRKMLEIASLNLSYTKLKAKDDCAIASVDSEEGENVAQGTQIFYTTCGEDLEVKLDIPESVIGNIKEDMKVKVFFSALKGKVYNGRVNEVGVSSISITCPLSD